MWRRDYGYDDGSYGPVETRRVSILGGSPPDMYSMGGGGPRHTFSEIELRQLGAAIFILSIAFALVLSGFVANRDFKFFAFMLFISFIIVSTGFALHELAHKFVAQRYGHWAEFRYSEFGLLLALVFSFMGVILAIPGAVYISGRVTREQNGIISAAGPLVNIAMAVLFWPVFIAGAMLDNIFLLWTGVFGISINPIIGGFNMIPLYPLDGSKILKWNIGVYIVMVIVIVALLYFAWF